MCKFNKVAGSNKQKNHSSACQNKDNSSSNGLSMAGPVPKYRWGNYPRVRSKQAYHNHIKDPLHAWQQG
jgi:hypothetical protein